jgi:hypothetical protein
VQEFAAKEKAKKAAQAAVKTATKSSLEPTIRGAVNQPPPIFLPSKIEQEDSALVSPCTLIPPAGPARRFALQEPSSSSCTFP